MNISLIESEVIQNKTKINKKKLTKRTENVQKKFLFEKNFFFCMFEKK